MINWTPSKLNILIFERHCKIKWQHKSWELIFGNTYLIKHLYFSGLQNYPKVWWFTRRTHSTHYRVAVPPLTYHRERIKTKSAKEKACGAKSRRKPGSLLVKSHLQAYLRDIVGWFQTTAIKFISQLSKSNEFVGFQCIQKLCLHYTVVCEVCNSIIYKTIPTK